MARSRPGYRSGRCFRVSPASHEDRLHRCRTVARHRRGRSRHAGRFPNSEGVERFASGGTDHARRGCRLRIDRDGQRRDPWPLAGWQSSDRGGVMSDSSNSRLLDRRSFLGMGAAALAAATAAFEGYKLTTRACRKTPPNPFVAAGKPLLVAVEGEDLHAMLRAGIEALGGLDPLARFGNEAIFRGNYVTPQPYPVTTAPEFTLAVSAELKRAGMSKTSLFDTHGTRLGAAMQPEHILGRLGVLDKLTQGGVPVLARDFLDPDEFVFVRNPAWPIAKPVAVDRILHEAPIVVSLPVVKRHTYVNFTCALKMHFGSVAMADRMLVHTKDIRCKQLHQHRLALILRIVCGASGYRRGQNGCGQAEPKQFRSHLDLALSISNCRALGSKGARFGCFVGRTHHRHRR